MSEKKLSANKALDIDDRSDYWKRRVWLPLVICFLASSTLYAQTTAPSGSKVGAEIRESDLQSTPLPSNIEFVSKLLQTELKKDRDTLGKVEDVAFDLETEHLAILVASNGTREQSKRYALLPFIPGDRLIQFDWEKKLTLQTQPLSAARAQAAELYRDHKQAVYWIDFAKKKIADSKGAFDEQDYPLTFYSTLKQWPVVDKEGKLIGKVDDVAIKSANGEILYIVMVSNDSAKRAIPLGAFVGEDASSHWSIELDAKQILKFKPFDLKAPPIEVDRGWVEYVATRYGRGGLQTTKKVE